VPIEFLPAATKACDLEGVMISTRLAEDRGLEVP
jgi:hypothetical protein